MPAFELGNLNLVVSSWKAERSIYLNTFLLFIIFILAACQTNPSEKKRTSSETFMWTGAGNLMDSEPRMLDNILAFAKRQDIIPYESGIGDTTELREFLELAQAHEIEKTWIEIGPRESNTNQATVRQFVENKKQRQPTIERFKRLARVYKQIYPDFARVTIFDEAPLGAFAHSGDGYLADFKTFKRHAPRAFAYMFRAFKSVMPDAEVGIFLHHPHNASPDKAGSYSYIREFMSDCDSLGTTPDFIFSDVYRGYFNRGYGVEATNDYIRDVVDYTGTVADQFNAKHFQLGQVHTIKLGYTPSRRQIDTNIEAMLDGNPDGIGWYWPNYASTNYRKSGAKQKPRPEGYDVSFDPFVPNAWGTIGPAGSLYGTSRDRFTYSYLSIQESTDQLQSAQRFDLWLYGYDFDHTEHKLYLKSNDEDRWEFIGFFNPQQDRDAYIDSARSEYMYSYNDQWHAVVFHGLSRNRFVDRSADGNHLQVKITTADGGDASRLNAIYAMPYRSTRHYATEPEVTDFIENHPRWVEINSLAFHIRPKSFDLDGENDFIGKLTE